MNSYQEKEQESSLVSKQLRLKSGQKKEKLSVPEQVLVPIGDIISQSSTENIAHKTNLQQNRSATLESQPENKKRIWTDKLTTSELDTLTTELFQILDPDLILKGKGSISLFPLQSKEISKNLLLPTEIDSVDSVLSSSKTSFHPEMGESWFSIKQNHLKKKSSQMTSFQSSQYSVQGSMVSDPTSLKSKSKTPYQPKTMKFRIFPNKEEAEKLELSFLQSRWYYNFALNIILKEIPHLKKRKKLSNITIRNLVRTYIYNETRHQTENHTLIFQDIKIKENLKDKHFTIPPWWNSVSERLVRGAIKNLVGNINSALTNLRNGNIQDFKLRYKSKKKGENFVLYEDERYPQYLNKIQSIYSYRTWKDSSQKTRSRVSFEEILKDTKSQGITHKGIDIHLENGKYYLRYTVPHNYYPPTDIRNDIQIKNESRIIALDPGIRKFMVGYDPEGKVTIFGEGANHLLSAMLLEIDKKISKITLSTDSIEKDQLRKEMKQIWKKIRNYVDELHWKTIKFLTERYDIILLPDFRISEMVTTKTLSKMTKRLMYMFSFHRFKQKMIFKCMSLGKELYYVDESYTSKTCCSCFKLNNVGGNEIYRCSHCGISVDRDMNGAINILIKNIVKK